MKLGENQPQGRQTLPLGKSGALSRGASVDCDLTVPAVLPFFFALHAEAPNESLPEEIDLERFHIKKHTRLTSECQTTPEAPRLQRALKKLTPRTKPGFDAC